jgi:hypothetical protein
VTDLASDPVDSGRRPGARPGRLHGVQRMPVILGSVLAVGLVAGAVLLDQRRTEEADVEVIYGDEDGLPEVLLEGDEYVATFDIEWTGPVSMRDGQVNVFKSRTGDATEDAPEEDWPVICTSEFDDVVFRQRVSCPFTAPGPGEFALLLEVRDGTDSVIGEGIYTHLIVDPSTTTAPPPSTTAGG